MYRASAACILRPPADFWERSFRAVRGREKGFMRFVSEGLPKSRNVRSATGLTSLVVLPGAREAFTPRELVGAYRDFLVGEPQYHDADAGIKASAYRYDGRVLFVYEESETGSIVLIHPTS
jgi:hypothetical protein